MTYEIRKLKKEDLRALLLEEMNAKERDLYTEEMMDTLEQEPFSVSIFYKNELMVCGGAMAYWFNRAQIWTLFSERSKNNFLPVFRGIKRFLDFLPFKRIELSIDYGFELGCRRAELLGFKLECQRAEKYLPNGNDVTLYSLVRGD